MKDIQEQLFHLIYEFPEKFRKEYQTETKWEEPLIGVASAEDPLFAELKTILSPSHALPSELVEEAKSVIAYFIPFDKKIAESNISGEMSSREWDYAYIETNNMLSALSSKLYEWISEQGYRASDIPISYHYDSEKLTCDWSHRSAAYIAGLGTFGINNMLITRKGCVGRYGSIITSIPLEATKRPDYEYCLYKKNGTCGLCVKRCPAKALQYKPDQAFKPEGSQLDTGGASEFGIFFKRDLCNAQIAKKAVRHYDIGDAETCGKCLTGVPCAYCIPGTREE